MKITILCVGGLKENYLKQAVSEYTKRITPYSTINIIEVAEERLRDGGAMAYEESVLIAEAGRLLGKINDKDFVIALDICGKQLSSSEFSEFISSKMTGGASSFVFVVGGSLGLHKSVLDRSNCGLSFSKMTFPHQLIRVNLLEQIYRAFRIMKGEPYHK
ncbi:MAG: 23S rRNA (pseudouridine(1915)-N(3))-methyltransferase RlmH [Defluviitaleaceae bacterium]|nr:23S rRNA (pseudouridine(1915)-N(3))-methyltransferase RlmH [Defluviitaleaceae bacterium]